MSDRIKWADLDKDLERGIIALKEELSAQYQKKIEELEKKAALVEEQKSYSSFYCNHKPVEFEAYPLRACPRGQLSKEELGKLQSAFSKEFSAWSLFTRFYIGNDERARYDFYVIRSNSGRYDDDRKNQDINRLTQQDEIAMRNFIIGFERGIHAVKIKPKRNY